VREVRRRQLALLAVAFDGVDVPAAMIGDRFTQQHEPPSPTANRTVDIKSGARYIRSRRCVVVVIHERRN
jgi:hypothetical protein